MKTNPPLGSKQRLVKGLSTNKTKRRRKRFTEEYKEFVRKKKEVEQ